MSAKLKYNFKSLDKLLNKIDHESKKIEEIYNDNIKSVINKANELDKILNNKREKNIINNIVNIKLVYELYKKYEKLYEEDNKRYKEYINSYSKSYIEMSEYYLGEDIPKYEYIMCLFYTSFIIIYYFKYYGLNEYDID